MKTVIIAAPLQPLLASTLHFLNREDIAVHTADTGDGMLKLHFDLNANLIVTKSDLPGMACETMINVIRRSETLRKVSILLLHDNTPVDRERSLRCNANAALMMPPDTVLLARKIQSLLAIAPRRSYRVVMNMSVDGKRNNKTFLCNTENISVNGMLIRTAEQLAVGDRLACSFYLPDGTRVSADGDVVRIVMEDSGATMSRYGIQFVNLDNATEASIAAFVEKDLQKRGEQNLAGLPLVA